MKKQINITPAEVKYESPVAIVLTIDTEGVLCSSGQNEEWEEDIL